MGARSHESDILSIALLALSLIIPPVFGQDVSEHARAILKRVQPQYPIIAQRMSIKGSVKLEVVVEADGRVKSISAKGGHPLLVEAAQNAVRQWKWQAGPQQTVESIEVRFNPL